MAGLVPLAGPHRGRVAAFDQTRGLGRLEEEDGTGFDFHATALADGTRAVTVGTVVVFDVVPAHRGRYEARAISAVAPSAG